VVVPDLPALLELDLDGLVIATPSALHAEQARRALARGLAVFCQKPLGRNLEETAAVVDEARRRDRLLDVDFSYRHVRGVATMRDLVGSGELGDIFASELVFHNAYGPDKPWFYDRQLSGGGCLVDLGLHLVDLLSWVGGAPVRGASGRCYSAGAPVDGGVEDFASAQLELADGAVASLTCSWRLSAGCDALIAARFFGTHGAVALENVGGSFYDFTVRRLTGTRAELLAEPPDAWGGRALVAWAERLAHSPAYSPDIEQAVDAAQVIDAIYTSDRRARARSIGAPP
jgi:predicted dehydrogenase